MRKRWMPLTLALVLLACGTQSGAETLPHPIRLPKGFHLSVFASGLEGVRMMALSPQGDLTVTQPRAGRVLILPDRNGDGKAERTVVFAKDLNRPHGLAWRDGDLYVAETGAVVKLSDADGDGIAETKQTITRDLPEGGMHWTRTLGFGPDGYMYVSVGSSCNVCVEEDRRRATILRFKPDGSDLTIYARGLRNAVGFAWSPTTKELWATENSRDRLGNDIPPDELNAIKFGSHYGWPYCYGNRQPDPAHDEADFCARTEPMALGFQAHSAPLGIAFYTGKQFPAEYRGDAFVAFHGSWDRNPPTGYKVVRVRFENGKPKRYEDFATGWLRGRTDWGRPVDVLTAPDGSLFVTDDSGGRIYRITYGRK
ncbi:Glucose / Sorbosone dehydrogenase [compost metagenome]